MSIKVVRVDDDVIEFDDGTTLYSYHAQDCCESHYLHLADLTIKDFEGLEFDFSSDSFFERVEDYGIALHPINGHPVRIPGYGYNNGYYSSDLSLVVKLPSGTKTYDISECQVIQE